MADEPVRSGRWDSVEAMVEGVLGTTDVGLMLR